MRHPVISLLRHHAVAGTVPTAEELAELRLDPTASAAVKAVAADARELHSAGEQGKADTFAFEKSVALVGLLPESQQDPTYLKADPNEGLEGLGPAELAARVRR